MAVFNPTGPDVNPPNWDRLSKPIQQPESDKSTGLTLATIGEGLDTAAKLADTTEKSYLKDKVETGVNDLRDSYTRSLVQVRNMQIAGTVPPSGALSAAGISADTLGETPAPDVPGGLQAGLDKASALGTAQAQNGGGGKANDTLYTGSLNALAKQLRNQYPGYKDYIDEQIKSVSGVDPANAFMKNLLEDINRGATNANSEKNKDLTFIDKYVDSIPGAALAREKYLRGDMDGQGLRAFVAQKSQLHINQVAAEAARAAAKSQGELTVQRVKEDFTAEAGATINDAFNTQRMATNVQTPKELSDYFTGQATGQMPQMDEAQNRMWLTNLAAQRNSAANILRSIALRRDSEGNSYAKSAGGLHNLKDEMDEQLGIYDNVIKFVKDKDYQGVYAVLNMNNAIHNKATNVLYNDPTVGEASQRMSAVNEAVGPQTGAILLQDAIINKMDKKYTEYVKGVKMDMLAPANPATPTTLSSAIDDARQKKIQDPNVYGSITDVAKVISNPAVKDEAKANLMTSLFSPKNYGVLNKITKDGPDAPGRQAAFETMTDPKITDAVAKMPMRTQEMYRQWAEKEWGGVLARDSIADLSKIKDQTFLKSYKIAWHTEGGTGNAPYFEVLNKQGRPMSQTEASYARPVTEVTTRMNSGIANLAHIERSNNGDTNAYIVKVLSNSGFDFKNNVEGIPTKMMNSILNAGRKPDQPPIDSRVTPPISGPNFDERFGAAFQR